MTRQVVHRMRCGTQHRRLYAIPDGARVDWGSVALWVIGPDGEHLRCPEPGCAGANGKPRAMRAFTVAGRFSDRIECGERCQSAIGPSCECRCAGENHGGASYAA